MALTVNDLLAEARASLALKDASEVETLIDAGYKVLDVREPAEFNMGHLPNATNIPRGVLEFLVTQHPNFSDNQENIVIYCKNGGRSTLAAHTLKRMGYDNVVMLVGGFEGWQGTTHKVEVDANVYQ